MTAKRVRKGTRKVLPRIDKMLRRLGNPLRDVEAKEGRCQAHFGIKPRCQVCGDMLGHHPRFMIKKAFPTVARVLDTKYRS